MQSAGHSEGWHCSGHSVSISGVGSSSSAALAEGARALGPCTATRVTVHKSIAQVQGGCTLADVCCLGPLAHIAVQCPSCSGCPLGAFTCDAEIVTPVPIPMGLSTCLFSRLVNEIGW